MLHYSTYEEAILGLREFGLEFNVKQSPGTLSDADCQSITIQSVDGLKSMKTPQQLEKGTKLL